MRVECAEARAGNIASTGREGLNLTLAQGERVTFSFLLFFYSSFSFWASPFFPSFLTGRCSMLRGQAQSRILSLPLGCCFLFAGTHPGAPEPPLYDTHNPRPTPDRPQTDPRPTHLLVPSYPRSGNICSHPPPPHPPGTHTDLAVLLFSFMRRVAAAAGEERGKRGCACCRGRGRWECGECVVRV